MGPGTIAPVDIAGSDPHGERVMNRRLRALPGLPGRLLLALAFASAFVSGLTPFVAPATVAASSSIGRSAEDSLLAMINNARHDHGLAPLRLDPRLRDLAEYRAGVMNSTNTMSHTVAGILSSQLTARGIQWYSEGEVIAWDSYAYPTDSNNIIFQMWHDATHWPLLMSNQFNYAGIGIVHNSNGKTWASMVFTQSADHTPPWVRNVSHSRSGTTVYWSWTGADTWLQSHTAGLKNFDVEYRVGAGAWTIIRPGTTARSLTLTGRSHGHYYGVRVRARDNAGNLSGWTAEVRIWVP
jgi:uncharacterized protein YkwD